MAEGLNLWTFSTMDSPRILLQRQWEVGGWLLSKSEYWNNPRDHLVRSPQFSWEEAQGKRHILGKVTQQVVESQRWELGTYTLVAQSLSQVLQNQNLLLLEMTRKKIEDKKTREIKETERAPGPDGKVCDLTSNCQFLTGSSYFSKVMWPFSYNLVTVATLFQVSSPWQFIRVFHPLVCAHVADHMYIPKI